MVETTRGSQTPHYDEDTIREVRASQPALTWKHLSFVALALITVAAGFLLLQIPDKYQLSIIFAVPGILTGLLVLVNPFVGIFLYILFEYLRPYDLVPALLYLRIPILIITVTAFAWVVRVSRTKTIYWNKLSWLYLLFVSLIGFTVVSAENYFYALMIFKEAILVFTIFVIASDVVNTQSRLRKLVWLLLLIHLFLAMKGTYNYLTGYGVTGGQRTSGIVGTSFLADENDFALTLNMMIPFAFFTVTYANKWLTRAISIPILIALTFGVVSSFSRGGWVGLVVAVVFCLLRSRRRMLMLVLVVVLAAVLLAVAPSEYWTEIQTISDTGETTASTRLNYWHAAFKMFLDHPIIGVGAGNGGAYMPDYVTGYKNPATQWGRAFHGTLPQILAELGIIGISLYIAMLYFVFTRLSAIRRKALESGERNETVRYADSIMGGILAYQASAIFLSTAYYPQFWTLITFAMIMIRCSESSSRSQANVSAQHPASGTDIQYESNGH
jgi:probable O-glycosylation ligase (exosortase A-associated)